jgi:hypothetical protein
MATQATVARAQACVKRHRVYLLATQEHDAGSRVAVQEGVWALAAVAQDVPEAPPQDISIIEPNASMPHGTPMVVTDCNQSHELVVHLLIDISSQYSLKCLGQESAFDNEP